MAKKIIPVVFAGIVVFGIILGVVGFVLGGRPGNFQINDGEIVYHEGNRQVSIASIPRFIGDFRFSWFGGWFGPRHNREERPERPEHAAIGGGSGEQLFIGAGDLKRLEIDVSAGYVVVQPGTEFGLSVQGDLPYENEYNNGVWTLKTEEYNHVFGLDFDWEDEDLTTFTFTVPANFNELDIQLDMGEADISGLTVNDVDATTDMGRIIGEELTMETALFSTDMGAIELNDFVARECELVCNMGGVAFTGQVDEKLVANCDMGGIEGTLVRPADYGWDMQADMGSVKLDGHEASGMDASSESNSGAATFFDLDCGMGSINIQFKA